MSIEADLQAAIQAARSGDCARARALFIRVLRQDPKNFQAWLWMSEVGKTLEEQTTSLERAQALCPPDAQGRRSLQPHLDRLRGAVPRPGAPAPAANKTSPSTQLPSPAAKESSPSAKKSTPAAGASLPGTKERPPEAREPVPADQAPSRTARSAAEPVPQDGYTHAERLARTGLRAEAIQLLNSHVKIEPQDERAWLLLSELVSDPAEKVRLLEGALAANPDNTVTGQRLAALRRFQQNPLQRGIYLEEAGEYAEAVRQYQVVIAHSKVPTERVEATRRIAEIELRKESDQAQPVNPTLNLARVTAGPVMLFLLMVFIQSGLNLFHAPFLTFPGIAVVLVGSFLVSVTTMRPVHPKWIERYGAPGSGDEPKIRRRLHLIGWLCMLAPFSLFLIEASFRLGALRASMLQGLP